MIGYYRIDMIVNGKPRHDLEFGYNAQDAVDHVRKYWAYMGELKIMRVYKDAGPRWEVTEAWE